MIPVKPSYSEYTSSTGTGMSESESSLLLLSFGFSSSRTAAAFSLHYASRPLLSSHTVEILPVLVAPFDVAEQLEHELAPASRKEREREHVVNAQQRH